MAITVQLKLWKLQWKFSLKASQNVLTRRSGWKLFFSLLIPISCDYWRVRGHPEKPPPRQSQWNFVIKFQFAAVRIPWKLSRPDSRAKNETKRSILALFSHLITLTGAARCEIGRRACYIADFSTEISEIVDCTSTRAPWEVFKCFS